MNLTTNRLSSIYVLDQDQAIEFYVGVLGLEVATDAELGFMRWLTVRVPGGGWPALSVDDVDATHAELVSKGVEITQPPSDQSSGRDMGLRDPFGNNIRIGTMNDTP